MRWTRSETAARPDESPASMIIRILEAFEPWMEEAVCPSSGADVFFPEKGGNAQTTDEAKRICGGCPVRTPCLAYALETQQAFGVWGGLTERERRALAKTVKVDRRDTRRPSEILGTRRGPQVRPPANGWDKRR